MELIVEISAEPQLKCSLSCGMKIPKLKMRRKIGYIQRSRCRNRSRSRPHLYITPSPITLPIKQAKTAV